MKSFSAQRLMCGILPAALLMLVGAWQAPALAASCTQGSTCVTVNGDGAMSQEQARESKEQWDDTHSLRRKVNTRVEKEFDKADRSIDDEERCNGSYNVNAYWESTTRKCLDRTTGRPINP
ncbi:hypothetical protein Z042_24685 [Chania multitudinisentens RB-25]|uniref:UPF0482 protein Z042_24685 n=1 Tax=Chania multitudinisentens RB-25 TaxID=1441930 RepID=W0LF12_9GAMM|nr:DUF1283 family protein [Chania multitudinisentens]AHG22448.1 hypothetical protein Z042_24685 [Chania multitudinisentens RB-25]